MKHHSTCHADYPEKPEDEQPQYIEEIDIGGGGIARVCTDCGATEITCGGGEVTRRIATPVDR